MKISILNKNYFIGSKLISFGDIIYLSKLFNPSIIILINLKNSIFKFKLKVNFTPTTQDPKILIRISLRANT